jgi:hypothetical protein
LKVYKVCKVKSNTKRGFSLCENPLCISIVIKIKLILFVLCHPVEKRDPDLFLFTLNFSILTILPCLLNIFYVESVLLLDKNIYLWLY